MDNATTYPVCNRTSKTRRPAADGRPSTRRLLASGMALALASLPALAEVSPTSATPGVQFSNPNAGVTQIVAPDNAIINYSAFNINANEAVNFVQPSADARVLNRIHSASPSQIDGAINANGIVYLVNPAGVTFGPSAVLNVGSLYAAAGSISDEHFLGGIDQFTQLTGTVSNLGQINAETLVALVGRDVTHGGTIMAPQGTVVLAAGKRVLIGQVRGRVHVAIDTEPAVQTSTTGKVEVGGAVKANSISIAAGDMYALAVSGSLDASSDTGVGGEVAVTGHTVEVTGSIDASGPDGGGTIRVGGDARGAGDMPTAYRTYVGPDATLDASATVNGDGGTVVVWAEDAAWYYGTITATGGLDGGDGGFVEVSGKTFLAFRGGVDAGAPQGLAGTILLDPANIQVIDGTQGADDAEVADGSVLAGERPGETLVISETALEALNGAILLEATDSISVLRLTDGVLDLTASSSVTMTADGSFFLEDGTTILTDGAPVSIDGGTLISMFGQVDTTGGAGTSSGDLTLTADDIGVFGTGLTLGQGTLSATAAGSFEVSRDQGASQVQAGTLSIDAADVLIGGTAPTQVTAGAGGITLVNADDVLLADTASVQTNGGNLTIAPSADGVGAVSLNGAIDLGATGALDVGLVDSIGVTTDITAGAVDLRAASSISYDSGTGPITIAADTQSYRAGTGAGTAASIGNDPASVAYRNTAGNDAPDAFTYRQDATIADAVGAGGVAPTDAQLGGSPDQLTLQSDGGAVSLDLTRDLDGTDLSLIAATNVTLGVNNQITTNGGNFSSTGVGFTNDGLVDLRGATDGTLTFDHAGDVVLGQFFTGSLVFAQPVAQIDLGTLALSGDLDLTATGLITGQSVATGGATSMQSLAGGITVPVIDAGTTATLNAGGGIDFTQLTSGGASDLTAGGDITQTGPTAITAGSVQLTSTGGQVVLNGVADLGATGTFSADAATGLSLLGDITAQGVAAQTQTGSIVFDNATGLNTIAADSQSYRAGAGAGGTTASIVNDPALVAFRNTAGNDAPDTFTFRQDASITDTPGATGVAPTDAQFGGSPGQLTLQSDGGAVNLDLTRALDGTTLSLLAATDVTLGASSQITTNGGGFSSTGVDFVNDGVVDLRGAADGAATFDHTGSVSLGQFFAGSFAFAQDPDQIDVGTIVSSGVVNIQTVNDIGGQSITAGGGVTLTAGGSIALTDITAGGVVIDASGPNITIPGLIDVAGNGPQTVTILGAGTLTSIAGIAGDASDTLDVTFRSGSHAINFNNNGDFFGSLVLTGSNATGGEVRDMTANSPLGWSGGDAVLALDGGNGSITNTPDVTLNLTGFSLVTVGLDRDSISRGLDPNAPGGFVDQFNAGLVGSDPVDLAGNLNLTTNGDALVGDPNGGAAFVGLPESLSVNGQGLTAYGVDTTGSQAYTGTSITLGRGFTTQGGGFSVTGDTQLGGPLSSPTDTQVTVRTVGGDITFNNNVTSTSGRSLLVDTEDLTSGSVVFAGDAGVLGAELAGLNARGQTIGLNGITTIGGIGLEGATVGVAGNIASGGGDIGVTGQSTISGDSIASTGGGIRFTGQTTLGSNTIDSTNGLSLGGEILFDGAVQLASLNPGDLATALASGGGDVSFTGALTTTSGKALNIDARLTPESPTRGAILLAADAGTPTDPLGGLALSGRTLTLHNVYTSPGAGTTGAVTLSTAIIDPLSPTGFRSDSQAGPSIFINSTVDTGGGDIDISSGRIKFTRVASIQKNTTGDLVFLTRGGNITIAPDETVEVLDGSLVYDSASGAPGGTGNISFGGVTVQNGSFLVNSRGVTTIEEFVGDQPGNSATVTGDGGFNALTDNRFLASAGEPLTSFLNAADIYVEPGSGNVGQDIANVNGVRIDTPELVIRHASAADSVVIQSRNGLVIINAPTITIDPALPPVPGIVAVNPLINGVTNPDATPFPIQLTNNFLAPRTGTINPEVFLYEFDGDRFDSRVEPVGLGLSLSEADLLALQKIGISARALERAERIEALQGRALYNDLSRDVVVTPTNQFSVAVARLNPRVVLDALATYRTVDQSGVEADPDTPARDFGDVQADLLAAMQAYAGPEGQIDESFDPVALRRFIAADYGNAQLTADLDALNQLLSQVQNMGLNEYEINRSRARIVSDVTPERTLGLQQMLQMITASPNAETPGQPETPDTPATGTGEVSSVGEVVTDEG